MAKQASTQWEGLKRLIDGASAAHVQTFCNVLGEQFQAGRLEDTKAALKRNAYNAAKARSAGDYKAQLGAYESLANTLRDAIGDTSNGNAAQDEARERREQLERTGRTGTEDALNAAQATLNGADKEALKTAGEAAKILASVQTLAESLEAKVRDFGAVTPAELKALVKAAISDIPARVYEVRREGELVGKVSGLQHVTFGKLLKAALARQADGFLPHVWLAGPAGSGKSTAGKNLAKASGREFFYNGALSMSHEVAGFIDAAGKYHETAFSAAYTKPAVYMFDDIDGSTDNSPLLALNAALANGQASFPCGMRDRHSDFQCVASANTWGHGATADYVGRIKIDGAFLDRFAVKIFWDYDNALEAQACGNEAWARRVQGARAKARAVGLKVLITPRASIAGAALIAAGHSESEAAELTYLSVLSPDQRRQIAGA